MCFGFTDLDQQHRHKNCSAAGAKPTMAFRPLPTVVSSDTDGTPLSPRRRRAQQAAEEAVLLRIMEQERRGAARHNQTALRLTSGEEMGRRRRGAAAAKQQADGTAAADSKESGGSGGTASGDLIDGDEAERRSRSATREGGWSSINNQSGHPYTPLGAPMLDFVFPVKRRQPTHPMALWAASASSGKHAQQLRAGGGGGAQSRQARKSFAPLFKYPLLSPISSEPSSAAYQEQSLDAEVVSPRGEGDAGADPFAATEPLSASSERRQQQDGQQSHASQRTRQRAVVTGSLTAGPGGAGLVPKRPTGGRPSSSGSSSARLYATTLSRCKKIIGMCSETWRPSATDMAAPASARTHWSGEDKEHRASVWQQQIVAEEKERDELATTSVGPSSSKRPPSSSSNSLDLHDPVRDLLALCTPRRADALEGSLAIRERVALSQARVHAVRAGASFEQIDRAAKARALTDQFARATLRAATSAASTAAPRSAGGTRDTDAIAAAAAAAGAMPFPHDDKLADEELGSALMQAQFELLAEQLARGDLAPVQGTGPVGASANANGGTAAASITAPVAHASSTPAKLLALQSAMGGPFPPNFNSNSFTNLQPHPLLAREELARAAEVQRKREEREHSAALASASSPQGSQGTSRGDGRASGGLGLNPLQLPDGSWNTATAIGTGGRSRSPSPPDMQTARSTFSQTQQSTARSTASSVPAAAPGAPLHHPHAPPASLSFHALRYTLHQSFGTLAAQREKEASARQVARRRDAARRSEATIKALRREALKQQGGELDPTSSRSQPASPTRDGEEEDSDASTARAAADGEPSRVHGRSRTRAGGHAASASFDASARAAARLHAPASDSATSRDVEYTRAVHASKYRREHHNSPTSHWHRLRENIQQRYTQARALCSMAYFGEGNLFQQGGAAIEAEERRQRRNMRARAKQSAAEAEEKQNKDGSTAKQPQATSVPLHVDDSFGKGLPSHMAHAPRSIHEGQILRQVANIQLPLSSSSSDSSSPAVYVNPLSDDHPSSLTARASLTLARAYADFDLAKRDLKERLYESLALQDSQRAETLRTKYLSFAPGFEDAERDILAMRLGAEKKRHHVVQQRLDNLEALEALVQFINQQNGGNNGEETAGGGSSTAGGGGVGGTGAGAAGGAASNGSGGAVSGSAIPLPRPGSDLTAPGPSGLVGFSNGAGLPSFEEIYVVEVLAALIDSGVPLCAHHAPNRRVREAIEARRRAHEAGQITLGGSANGPPVSARAAGTAAATASTLSSRRGSVTSVSTNATSTRVGAGGLLSPSSAAASSIGFGSLPPTPLVGVTSSSLAAAAAASASLALTPPPSLLLLLLCLSRDLFRLKEVRELLERWVRLTGTPEEVLDAALRMIGVDPREPLYSAKAPKATQGQQGGATSADAGETGGATNLGPNGQPLLFHESNLSGLLDASTKAALLHSSAMGLLQNPADGGGGVPNGATSGTAGGAAPVGSGIGAVGGVGGVAAPPLRPLSSVILAPVSLGAWEVKRAQERVKLQAREAARRARTVRDLTTSSNAATRHRIGLANLGAARQAAQRAAAASAAAQLVTAQGYVAAGTGVDYPSPRHKHPTGVSQTLAGHSAQEREDRVLLKAGMEQMHARVAHE